MQALQALNFFTATVSLTGDLAVAVKGLNCRKQGINCQNKYRVLMYTSAKVQRCSSRSAVGAGGTLITGSNNCRNCGDINQQPSTDFF
jgi:hypothetical protein